MSPDTIGWLSWWRSLLDLHRLLSSAGPDHDRTLIARRIEATDGQIDRQVCRAICPDRGGDRNCGGWGEIGEMMPRMLINPLEL